jgi:HEAT repeat protein
VRGLKVPDISEEVEKLKIIATSKQIYYWEREEAVRALGDIGNRQAVLALLDIANDRGLYYWERELALSRAREILRAGKI